MIWFFTHFTRLLKWLRFKRVHMINSYSPNGKSTVYYLNHNYWWDGLIPLYLNHRLFKQHARAFMEDKQMKKHWFFSKIGAFSINLNNPRSVISSLRFAVDSLSQSNSGVYIYPEGKIVPPSSQVQPFKGGLAWLAQNCSGVDFVPVAIHIDNSKQSKPELYLMVGSPKNPDPTLSKNELTTKFENELNSLMRTLFDQIYHVHS
ncbi:MAG: lysophospholipid acyltransferase family protein [Balneolaceae bacterium]|nr:lysophospholipid acyltransferase family protein [Balneolaceae bacterium]